MTKQFSKVQARGQLDQVLNQHFGKMQVITKTELEKVWGSIKDITNAERIEYWLKQMGKQVCPQCAEFLRKKLGFSVSLEYIATAGKGVNPISTAHK